jgi:hypothetical protein
MVNSCAMNRHLRILPSTHQPFIEIFVPDKRGRSGNFPAAHSIGKLYKVFVRRCLLIHLT